MALSGVALANRYEGSRGYLGDGGLGCGDVQRPEKSPRNVATREEVEEEGGRRKVGSLESLAGVARGGGGGGAGGRGLDAKRVDSALLDQGPLSLVRRERRRGYGAGVGPGEGCER